MSAYRFQLSDARANYRIRNVAGACPNSPEFADQVNTVTETLWNRGAWWRSEVLARLCVFGCNIVWPRYVSTVMGLRTCAGRVELKNNWYIDHGAVLRKYPVSRQLGIGRDLGWWGLNWVSNLTASDTDTSPIFTEITGNTGKLLRYHVVKSQDYGKTIQFYGKQFGAQPLQELDANGVWQNGLTLTATNPIAQTSILVTKIDEIVRQPTQGMAYLYKYDPTSGDQRMLAAYEPSETNPQYQRSKINSLNYLPARVDANGAKSWQVEALVKLEFVPVVHDRDFLLIDNWGALAYGIQAVKFDEANDAENAEKFWTKAIRELNFESRNKNPADQFVTRVNVMGSARVVTNPI